MSLPAQTTRSLRECLASVDTPKGRRRVMEYLDSRPFPHYEPAPDKPGVLVRIDSHGTRISGRFVNHLFESVRSDD